MNFVRGNRDVIRKIYNADSRRDVSAYSKVKRLFALFSRVSQCNRTVLACLYAEVVYCANNFKNHRRNYVVPAITTTFLQLKSNKSSFQQP